FKVLKRIFADPKYFAHHDPLPCSLQLSDEGAANHTRLCSSYGHPGLEIFTYGRIAFDSASASPRKFPARQTREASAAIARNHLLDPASTMFVSQSPEAIDAGVFH